MIERARSQTIAVQDNFEVGGRALISLAFFMRFRRIGKEVLGLRYHRLSKTE